MLQPLQLQDVSLRYPDTIAELRDFLQKAGLPLDSAEGLTVLATRLHEDSTLRRDLTSHIWVALASSEPPASYADLLAMLAVAAVGTTFAAAADGRDAHDLLRFLIEARRSFEGVSTEGVSTPEPAAPPPRPVLWAPEPAPLPLRNVAPSHPESFVEEEIPATLTDHTRHLGWAVAACLLVLLLGGVWWHLHSAVGPTVVALTPTATGTALPPPAPSAPAPAQPGTTAPHPVISANNRQPIARSARVLARPGAAYEPTPASSSGQNPPAAADSVVSSQPLARSSRRSRPTSQPPSAGLVPSVQPVSIAPSTESAPTAASPARGGTVHPTSLGIMAANVLYSPAPAYPPEASAAHVQGEVKVEAEVDPQGNVASARVISGPPLLREAAVDAVARWHYRPYVTEGKPTTTLALVVMDFKLP